MELVLDELLNFGYSAQYEILYKKICRHIFHRHTQLVAEHVAMFRESIARENKDNPELTDDEKIDKDVREVLERYRADYEKLAKPNNNTAEK